jgi:hypothetical protein
MMRLESAETGDPIGELLAKGEATATAGSSLRSCGYSDQGVTKELTFTGEYDDVEVAWFEDTKCLCVQPHPEFTNASLKLRMYVFNTLLAKVGLTNNWFVEDEAAVPTEKPKPVDDGDDIDLMLAAEIWENYHFGVAYNLSSRLDKKTNRRVFIDENGDYFGYADVTQENCNKDPLGIFLNDACPVFN